MGEAALPALEKAGSKEARRPVQVIGIGAKFTPKLLEAMPDVDERLADGPDHEWARVFFETLDEKRHPSLRNADRAALIGPALRAARKAEERDGLAYQAVEGRFAAAVPALHQYDSILGAPGQRS